MEQWREEGVHPKRRPYDTVAGLKGKIGAVVRFVTAKKLDKEQIREGVVRMARRFGISRRMLSKCARTGEEEDGPAAAAQRAADDPNKAAKRKAR